MKYLHACAHPSFWPALIKGVMPTMEHIAAIRSLRPSTLIDVGANKGQFSLMARQLFPGMEIHAFEPLDQEAKFCRALVRAPLKLYSTALGKLQGTATFFVTSRMDSSSLLEPDEKQRMAYGVGAAKTIQVPVARLADVLDIATLPRPILLKIDVQGGELDVLQGALGILPMIDWIYCEASYVELYQNQPLASAVVNFLSAANFNLSGVFNQSVTAAFGATQADFLFTLNKIEK